MSLQTIIKTFSWGGGRQARVAVGSRGVGRSGGGDPRLRNADQYCASATVVMQLWLLLWLLWLLWLLMVIMGFVAFSPPKCAPTRDILTFLSKHDALARDILNSSGQKLRITSELVLVSSGKPLINSVHFRLSRGLGMLTSTYFTKIIITIQ